MNDKRPQLELSGLERFSHLEDKIFRMVEEFKIVRKDNENLRAENVQLKEQMEELRRDESAIRDNLAHFQKEREELRNRVEKALNLLATLEANK
ncbi:MAG TPA: cell division protein ZapB [Acidobacteriota bacterium]|nr:cell division protein ZapB [Acidobacteriota bacterium]